MARKSRKEAVYDTSGRSKSSEKRYLTAIYVRLSVENSGKDDDGAALETQKEVCIEYVKSCPYLIFSGVYEDNGHTGTDFLRPGFTRLMDDVKSGVIECIVVRDLSRFGRNYIETGTYLERIFPKLGIRFISVKEQFDSFTVDGSNESLAIPLQNLINDYYSKDISRKVSAALKVQRENGTYTWHNLPYGYQWNEEKTKIIPYEPYAGYVKDMFRWMIEGIPRNQIKKRLNDSGIPTGQVVGGVAENKRWTITTVTVILRNHAYVGDKVLGKQRNAIYMGIKGEHIKPDEWIVFRDDHEALVSHEDFEKVQNMIDEQAKETAQKREKTKAEREKIKDLLEGKVYCRNCGGRILLQKKRTAPHRPYYGYYECLRYRRSEYQECTQHFIRQSVLYEKIAEAIKLQAKAALRYEKLIAELQDSSAAKKLREDMSVQIQSITMRLRGINNKRAKLYEDYADGMLDEDEYSYAKKTYDADSEALNKKLDEAVSRKDRLIEVLSPDNRWISMMKKAVGIKELTKELADAVIERIDYGEGGNVVITVKYQDICRLTKKYVGELSGEEAEE